MWKRQKHDNNERGEADNGSILTRTWSLRTHCFRRASAHTVPRNCLRLKPFIFPSLLIMKEARKTTRLIGVRGQPPTCRTAPCALHQAIARRCPPQIQQATFLHDFSEVWQGSQPLLIVCRVKFKILSPPECFRGTSKAQHSSGSTASRSIRGTSCAVPAARVKPKSISIYHYYNKNSNGARSHMQ